MQQQRSNQQRMLDNSYRYRAVQGAQVTSAGAEAGQASREPGAGGVMTRKAEH